MNCTVSHTYYIYICLENFIVRDISGREQQKGTELVVMLRDKYSKNSLFCSRCTPQLYERHTHTWGDLAREARYK